MYGLGLLKGMAVTFKHFVTTYVDDIFWSRNNDVQVRQDDINLDVFNTRDSRRVKMTFKYKFGNNKVKRARRRSTATDAETSRIG